MLIYMLLVDAEAWLGHKGAVNKIGEVSHNEILSPGCGSIEFRMGHWVRAVIRGGSSWALNEECVRHGAYLFSDCIWPKVIAVDMAWVVAYGNDEWWLAEQTTVKPNKCEVTTDVLLLRQILAANPIFVGNDQVSSVKLQIWRIDLLKDSSTLVFSTKLLLPLPHFVIPR